MVVSKEVCSYCPLLRYSPIATRYPPITNVLVVYTAERVEWGMGGRPKTIYSAKSVRERLGISDGMLRRYAIALESVTSKPIHQHPARRGGSTPASR